MTDAIHAFDVPVVVMAFVYFTWQFEYVVGCPRCVRFAMLKRLYLNILSANIVSPGVIFLILIQIIASHAADRPGIPPAYRHWKDAEPLADHDESWRGPTTGRMKRLLIVLLVLIVVGAFAIFLLPQLADR